MVDIAVPPYSFDRIDRRTKTITPALISAICERIVEAVRPERLVLFGSRASGRANRESDIDLLVCLPEDHSWAGLRPPERSDRLFDLFAYRSFGMDVIVLTKGEVEAIRQNNEGEWDLVLEILSQGTVLYDTAK